MRRLHIGMWHGLKEEEWDQLHFGMIQGLEASLYETEEDWRRLRDFCKLNNLSFGIHSPIYSNERAWLPQVTSSMEQKRIEALSWIEQEVEFAAIYRADYVLFHYPFPAILPKNVDYNYWPREVNFPTMKWDQLSREEFLYFSEEAFKRLVELQVKYKQKIILEYDFFGHFEEEYLQMFDKYKEIQLVIDTQRLDIHKRAFPGFDPYRFLIKAAPYVYLVHHSTTIYGEDLKRHVPVLQESIHNPNVGDAHKYLEFLSKYNKTFHIHFEHNPNLVTKEQLKECYELALDAMKIKI